MRLGIDLDGVVADFNSGWMNRYNDEFETDLNPEMVTHWDAMVPLTHFASTDDFWEWARNGDKPSIFRNLAVFPEAAATLRTLSRDHDIVIITTKPDWAHAETFEWIGENAVPTREVHITDAKWRIDCDVYLDDGPHNLESLAKQRPDRTVCRFVRPWNRPVVGTIDVDTWNTFEALVNRQFC